MSEWQPIETAPKDIDLLLGWWREWPERVWESSAGLAGSTKGGWLHGQATHWMPMPTPPSESPGNEENKRSNLVTLELIRSIVVSASIKAGENLSPGSTAAIAWRTIGDIQKVLLAPTVTDKLFETEEPMRKAGEK
jgi:hypothetical protein